MIVLFFSAAMIAVAIGGPQREISSCLQPIDRLPCNTLFKAIEREGLFSFRKETLENDCPALLDSFRCLRSHWTKCKPFAIHNMVVYMSGLKAIMEDLCEPRSELRKDFEKYSSCLSTSSQELQKCSYVAQQKVSEQLMRTQKPYLLSANVYKCLTHIEFAICIRNVAEEKCGSDAGQLLGRLVERTVQPYRRLNCYQPEHLIQPSKKEEYKKLLF